MASQAAHQLHFIVFPFMSQGHMIPMIDIARLLAQRGVLITIVTTPLNAARFQTIISRDRESGLQIRLVQVQFPWLEAGLPEGCENVDMLPSLGLAPEFFSSTNLLLEPVQKLLEELTPQPNCIISDQCLPYTFHIANKFCIPRIVFNGTGCFCLLCASNVGKALEGTTSESEPFVMPGLPDKVEFTKCQVVFSVDGPKWQEVGEQMVATALASYGMIVNTFEELEPAYVKEYRKAQGNKVWCVGPVSLRNKDNLDKAQRGNNKASIDEHSCLKWLDSQEHSSVVYVCLGSMCNLIPAQLIELGLGLEASNKPFIWVVRGGFISEELKKWIFEYGFEERIKGRGLLIQGWAPQVLILSHPAIGGFLTHCGWNSTLEGVCAGVQFITWPLFGDQFFNEKFIVQILKIGIRVGVEVPVNWGEEEKTGVLVKKEDVKKAVERLMEEGEEGESRRERATNLGNMAKKALEEGGSSHLNTSLLIEDIMQQARSANQPIIRRETTLHSV